MKLKFWKFKLEFNLKDTKILFPIMLGSFLAGKWEIVANQYVLFALVSYYLLGFYFGKKIYFDNRLKQVFFITLPVIILCLIVLGQFQYLARNKSLLGYHTDIRELDSKIVKELNLFKSPNHFKLIDSSTINRILHLPTNYYSNIIFRNKVKPMYGEGNAVIGVIGKADKIKVIELENEDVYFGSNAISYLFELTEPSLSDIIHLSNTFARDVVKEVRSGKKYNSLNRTNEEIFQTAQLNFIRSAFNWFEPMYKNNVFEISNRDILQFILEKNLTNSSRDLKINDTDINGLWLVFTFITYFLLAIEASLLANLYKATLNRYFTHIN